MLSSIIHTGIGNLQGFRNGKIAPKVAYLMTYPNNKILKLGTDLVNRKRLFYRGGDGNMLNKNSSIRLWFYWWIYSKFISRNGNKRF